MDFMRKIKAKKNELKRATGIAQGMAKINKVKSLKNEVAQKISSAQGLPPNEKRNVNLEISSLPGTVEDFTLLRDKLASTPEGAVAVFLVALNILIENEALGMQCLTISVDASETADSLEEGAYKGKTVSRSIKETLDTRLMKNPEIGRAYWKGASPENNYTPELPYQALIYRQLIDNQQHNAYMQKDEITLFVRSEGTASPRPIRLMPNTSGVWKAKSFGALIMGVAGEQISNDGDDL